MKDVSQYPVKHPFGATYAPWSKNKPHLGVDRPTPMGTPLIVNSQLIGYTGKSGTKDPHHHLQRVRDGKVIDPKNDGFILPSPVTIIDAGEPTGSEQPEIGKHIRLRDGRGEEWSHFHLSEIKVKPGDTVGGEMTEEQAKKISKFARLMQHLSEKDASDYAKPDVPYLKEKGIDGVITLLEGLFRSKEWQNANHKAVHFEEAVANAVAQAGDAAKKLQAIKEALR